MRLCVRQIPRSFITTKISSKQIGIEGDWQPKNWQEIIDVASQLKEANADVEDFIPLFMYASGAGPEETSMRTFQLLLSGTNGRVAVTAV